MTATPEIIINAACAAELRRLWERYEKAAVVYGELSPETDADFMDYLSYLDVLKNQYSPRRVKQIMKLTGFDK